MIDTKSGWSVSSSPIVRPSVRRAGSVFGGIVLLALITYFMLRFMLNRSKRMFGEQIDELTILDKPETWSPLHAAEKQG